MLKRLFQAIRSQGVMKEVEQKTRKMFALARKQYSASVQALLDLLSFSFGSPKAGPLSRFQSDPTDTPPAIGHKKAMDSAVWHQ